MTKNHPYKLETKEDGTFTMTIDNSPLGNIYVHAAKLMSNGLAEGNSMTLEITQGGEQEPTIVAGKINPGQNVKQHVTQAFEAAAKQAYEAQVRTRDTYQGLADELTLSIDAYNSLNRPSNNLSQLKVSANCNNARSIVLNKSP